MKNKKILAIIIAIIVSIATGLLVYKVLSNKTSGVTPVLYEVTKAGSDNKMYLFGSIHMADKELTYPDYVLDAYNKSHYIACEYNMIAANNDMEKMQEIAMNMLYQDGTTIKDHIDEDTYNKLVNFLTEKNSYTVLYDYYKPVFFYSLMSSIMGKDAKLDSEAGVDEYFLNKAINDKKEILEVESMESQMNLLLGFSDELYLVSIRDVIDNYQDNVQELIQLYDSWKKGDINKILELNDEDIDIKDGYTEKQIEEIKEFNKKIIDDRNKTMTDKAISYFNDNKDVFYMVGTLHIIGEDGIAHSLEEKGYTVKRIQ